MRTVVVRKCREHADYRFVVARKGGVVCCAANDVAHLCSACAGVVDPREPSAQAQAYTGSGRTPMTDREEIDLDEEAPPAISFTDYNRRFIETRGRVGTRREQTKNSTTAHVGEILRREMAARHAAEFGGMR